MLDWNSVGIGIEPLVVISNSVAIKRTDMNLFHHDAANAMQYNTFRRDCVESIPSQIRYKIAMASSANQFIYNPDVVLIFDIEGLSSLPPAHAMHFNA